MKSLKLFNAVLKKESAYLLGFDWDIGIIIPPESAWAMLSITEFYRKEKLSGNDLNKTFHKSWKKILEYTREELALEQIKHYLSTYGTDFTGEIYIPAEVLEVPEGITFKVINALSKEEMTDKALAMLKSGMALKEETVDDLIGLLDELDYTFTGKEGIRNKEATVKIAELFKVYPDSPEEFLRFIIYRATGETLLIKSPEAIAAIKAASFNPSILLKDYGLERLAEIFNRFKPLFLAFKSRCPKTINKISRMSKYYHKPMVENPLNHVTHKIVSNNDIKWLDNATPYALFKALQACHSRAYGQTDFVYKIRNGKSWVRSGISCEKVSKYNYRYLLNYLKGRFDLSGKTMYFPEGIDYALPTSEKMYVGNLPTGTKIYGEKLAVGLYWENSWGANDIDLSGLNIGGKVGWNAAYDQEGSLLYSGDITNAPKGAVEYLHASKGRVPPTLLMANIYSGEYDCKYKLVVGKGADVTRKYMMNPADVMLEAPCQSVQKQNVIGMFLPEGRGITSFVVMNFGAGNARVSGDSDISNVATRALHSQWNNPLTLESICSMMGATITNDKEAEIDIDLSVELLEKDTFINLFNS